MNVPGLGELRDFQRFDPNVFIREASAVNKDLGDQCVKLKRESEKHGWSMGRLLSLMIAMLVNPEWSVIQDLCKSHQV